MFLRTGGYTENHTASLPVAVEHGAVLGAAEEGRFAAAPRRDYAQAAATVLTSPGHENRIYELGGDEPFTLSELAAETAKQSSKPVRYQNLSEEEYTKALEGFGLPHLVAVGVANADAGAARGELTTSSHSLRDMIGRPTGIMRDSVAAALGR